MQQLIKNILQHLGRWGIVRNLLLGIVSGLCSFLFINLVNRAIGTMITGRLLPGLEYAIAFSATIGLFLWSRRTLYTSVITLSQTLFWNLRKQILSLVLNADYEPFIKRKVAVNTAILNDVTAMVQASWSIIDFFTATILGIACLIYLLTISFVLFLVTLATVITGVIFHSAMRRRVVSNFEQSIALENDFIRNFNAVLDGFKEIYLSPRKGQEIYEKNIVPISVASKNKNIAAHSGMLTIQLTGQILFYALIACVILFFGKLLGLKSEDIISFIFTLLFLLGSISTVIGLMPNLVSATVAYRHLLNLKSELESIHTSVRNHHPTETHPDFRSIEIVDLTFVYQTDAEESAFTIGPVRMKIEAGECIFIYGANGSGKTTLMNCILGLYRTQGSPLRLNGKVVTDVDYPDYQACFAVVFSDLYLFDELFAVDHVDGVKWKYYLELFELTGKVELTGRKLSTTNLSTGQRKRIALIMALMENKPVLVLDEWAADQDPHFRKKFYTVILPLLKQQGITTLAITHDDRYYGYADRLYCMEDGELIEENIELQNEYRKI